MSSLVCIFKVSIYLQRSEGIQETGKNNGEMERRKEGREGKWVGSREKGKRKEKGKQNAEKSQQNQMIQNLVPSPDQ